MWREKKPYTLLGKQLNSDVVEISLKLSQKAKIELQYDPGLSLPGKYPENCMPCQRDICIPCLLLLYLLNKNMESMQLFINTGIDNEHLVTHTGTQTHKNTI